MYQVDESQTTLFLDKIRIDGGTQPRCEIDESLVAEYAEAMADGAEFPQVVVFLDGVELWLADGFHRYHAAARAGRDDLRVKILRGTKRDAVLYSVGANSAHGQRRTNADKRKAVMTLLDDEEWRGWNDSEIARRANVSQPFVTSIKESHLQTFEDGPRKVQRGNQTYEMNTENIGQREKRPEGYGEIAPNAHEPTYDPPPMTPMTAFEFPKDAGIVAAALFERFGANFSADLIDKLEALIGRTS